MNNDNDNLSKIITRFVTIYASILLLALALALCYLQFAKAETAPPLKFKELTMPIFCYANWADFDSDRKLIKNQADKVVGAGNSLDGKATVLLSGKNGDFILLGVLSTGEVCVLANGSGWKVNNGI
jgi:hypothetical protein